MFKGKPLIPREDVPGVITHEITKNGAPMLSRDSLYKYLQQLYWGIKKNDCDVFLKKQEFYQLSKVRPAQHTRINKEKKEGNTMALTTGRYGQNNERRSRSLFHSTAYTSTFQGGERNTSTSTLLYLQTANYVWAYGMTNKKAATAMKQAQKLWEDCFNVFGKYPTGLICDAGTEFQAEHQQWVENESPRTGSKQVKGVPMRISTKATFVERRIGILAQKYRHTPGEVPLLFQKSLGASS